MNIKKINYKEYKDKLNQFSFIDFSVEYAEFAKNFWQAEAVFLGVFDDSGDNLQAVLSLFSRRENGLKILEGAIKTYTEPLYLEEVEIDTEKVINFIKKNYQFDMLDLAICEIVEQKDLKFKSARVNTYAYVAKLDNYKDENEILMKEVGKKTRNQIKKSYQHSFEKEICRDIDKFYRIYLLTMERLGAKPKNKKYFYDLKNAFGDNFYIILAKKDNKIVGGNLFLIKNSYLSLLFNVSLKDYWKYYINNFLYWEMILFGMKNGIKFFDFGINAKRDKAQIHFKEGFGAVKFKIYHIVVLKSFKSFWNLYKAKFIFLIKLLIRKLRLNGS